MSKSLPNVKDKGHYRPEKLEGELKRALTPDTAEELVYLKNSRMEHSVGGRELGIKEDEGKKYSEVTLKSMF